MHAKHLNHPINPRPSAGSGGPPKSGSVELLPVVHHHSATHHCAANDSNPSLLLCVGLSDEEEVTTARLQAEGVLLADLLLARLHRGALLQADDLGGAAVVARVLEAAQELPRQDEAALPPLAHPM